MLNQSVKRNIERFPDRFMFQLTESEYDNLRSQIVTSSSKTDYGGRRYLPYVFTEEGSVMLSSILKSAIAIEVSIRIIDAFVKMRKYLSNNLIEQVDINKIVLSHNSSIMKLDNDVKLLQETLDKFEEKENINEIYFNGQVYDAYSRIKDIMFEVSEELIIIDSYGDKTILDMIKNINCKVILITSKKSKLTSLDISKYNEQYNNLKVIYSNSFHDRYFILDRNKIYHSGTSINYAGNKTFSINVLEDDVVKEALLLKINKEMAHNE